MAAEHKEGRYFVRKDPGATTVYIESETGVPIAQVYRNENARVLAAAPELYKMLLEDEFNVFCVNGVGKDNCCDVCLNPKEKGHSFGCKKDALLRWIEGFARVI